MVEPYGDYYREIYAKGTLANERPTQPIVMRSLLPELDLTMALSGITALEQLGPDALTLRRNPV